MVKIYLTVSEAAELLRMKRSTLYKMTSGNQIPHYKFGKFLLFKESELIEFVEKGLRPTQVIDLNQSYDRLDIPRLAA